MSPETDADSDRLSAVFLRDAKPRLDGEAMASRLGEAQLRRRQALEINDNVVQGLVAAAYALDQGQVPNVAELPRADPVRGSGDDGRPARAARR